MKVFTEFLATVLISFCASGVVFLATLRILALNGAYRRMEGWDGKYFARSADRAVYGFVLAYVLILANLAILRHLSLNSGVDLGIFDQAIWNSLHGRLLEVTIVPDVPGLLGQRFSPILLALVPLYAIWTDPIVLLIVQTLALGSSAIPIYWYARKALGHLLAVAVAVIYLLYPATQYVNLYDFHEVALTAPLFAFATFFLLRCGYKGFLVCLGLALLTKEEIAFSLIAFGAFVFWVRRCRRLGIVLASFGFLWGIFLLEYLIPFFRGGNFGTGYYYFGHGHGAGTGRYDYLGYSLPEIITTMITRPGIVLQNAITPAKAEYVLHLLVPLAFIPLIGADVGVLALPTLGLSLISTFAFQYDISSHYAAPLVPLVFFAAVAGLQRLLEWRVEIPILPWRSQDSAMQSAARKGALLTLLIVAGSLSYYFQSPGPLAQHFKPEQYALDARTALGNMLARSVPSDAVVVAQEDLQAHVSGRRLLYEIPRIPDYRQADYLLADKTRDWYFAHQGYWEYFLGSGYFEVVADQYGLVAARRRTPAHSLQIRFGDQMVFLGYSIVVSDTLRGGMTLRPVVLWRANSTISERYKMAVRVVDGQGHLWAEEDREPDDGFSPTDQWESGRAIGDQYALRLPPTMPAGEYEITVAVHAIGSDDPLLARDAQGKFLGTEAAIAAVHVEKNKASFTASQLDIPEPLFVDMQEMRFLGYVPPRETISPGELLQVGVYWRAREKPRGDYVVAVQLRDVNARVAFEHSARPANGTYPTTQWDAGEVLLDWHDFELPRDVPLGTYQIVVVLRDATSGVLLGETFISTLSVVN